MYQSAAATAAAGVPVPVPALLAAPMELGSGESRPEEARASTATAGGAAERCRSAAVQMTSAAHGDAEPAAAAPFSCDSVSDLKWSTQRQPLQKGSSVAQHSSRSHMTAAAVTVHLSTSLTTATCT